MTEQEYLLLRNKLYKLSNIDLNLYKSQQMQRRLKSYIENNQYTNIIQFCQALEKDSHCLNKLVEYLTINVTEFFRDNWAYLELKEKILPLLLKNKNTLKIWSAGCSFGCEPFSIAIILLELTGNDSHMILATDVDQPSLSKAIAGGPYTSDFCKQIPSQYVEKYFTQNNGRYYVNLQVRKMVNFKRHNLLSDPFDRNFDLICCRNVTIYLTEEAKKSLNKNFVEVLNPDGILFVGATEFIMNSGEIGLKKIGSCFYQKIAKHLSLDIITGSHSKSLIRT